ncbi:MAG: 3-oxoacyl-ACP reductase FabG [Deltaproteobacteria bacterium]|nr:3-oxoacyl-ACP reductase FabG [Deltaproteobacteria bacterium]
MIVKKEKGDILVTGSSRGIGRAIALAAAREGYGVVVHCKDSVEKARVVCEEIKDAGGRARLLQFDVSHRAKCQEAIAADIAENDAYYGVVCNAGITADNPFPAISDDEWDGVINTNLNSFYNVLKPVVMPMIRARRGGRIIAITSVSGIIGNRGQVNYSAAKGGVIAACKALALELAKRQITVNCVAPGLIETDMVAGAPVAEIIKAIPLQRVGKAEEVAGLVSYLLSDSAAYITRQVISINGGII